MYLIMCEKYTDAERPDYTLQHLWRQSQSGEFCDVLLITADGMEMPVHRYILSVASEYFNLMFTSAMRESCSKEIKMSSLNGDTLKSLIEYCYTGHMIINEDNVLELLKSADMLLFNNIIKACGEFLAEQLHPSNSLGFMLLAERHRCQSLLQKAKDYSLEHYMCVSKEDEFLRLNAEQLNQLLICDNLCVTAEEVVFNSLMTWIAHDSNKREKHKYDLLKSVRMSLLERSFLFEHVKPVCDTNECRKLYAEAMAMQLLPDLKIINGSKSRKFKINKSNSVTRSYK